MAPVINYVAVLVAAIASIVLGFLWYGPFFGKKWMRLSGIDPNGPKPKMGKTQVIMLISALLMAFVLDHALIFGNAYLGTSGFSGAVMGAFWNWLGFIAPVTVGAVLWEKKSWSLWMINAGYYLVSLIIMSWILVSWM